LLKDLYKNVSKKINTKIKIVLKRYILLNKARLKANKSFVKKAIQA